jgi:hypothetical protein
MYIQDFEGATISKIELTENDYDYTSIKIICKVGEDYRELLILSGSPAYDHWLTITTAQHSKVPEAIACAMSTTKDALVKLDAGQDIDGILETFKTMAESWAADVIQGGAQTIIGKPGNTTVQLKFDLADTLIMNSKKFDALVSAGILEVEPVEQWKGGKNWYVSCAVLMDALEEVEAT